VVLIFDEVMSGFRVALGGMVERTGVVPDLVTYGKVIGGGLPVGAYGGREDLMRQISPIGPIYQAGTLSGNPLAMAAGLATLKVLEREKDSLYPKLEALSAKLCDGLSALAKEADIDYTGVRMGSMFTGFFNAGPVTDYATATHSDAARFGRYFRGMLERGIYLAPSQYETGFMSGAHAEQDVYATLDAAAEVFAAL
jgi:glutamate-1-semialdehyde 2,1-aminomutase